MINKEQVTKWQQRISLGIVLLMVALYTADKIHILPCQGDTPAQPTSGLSEGDNTRANCNLFPDIPPITDPR